MKHLCLKTSMAEQRLRHSKKGDILRKCVNMDQIHPNSSMPLIVQVYPSAVDSKMDNAQILHLSHAPLAVSDQSKLMYQQSITSEAQPVSSSDFNENHPHHTQMLMSCQQTQLQTLQTVPMQAQVIPTEGATFQFGSHFILPQMPVHKQHDVEQPQETYLAHYGNYLKEKSCAPEESAKCEQICDLDSTVHQDSEVQTKSQRKRGLVPNPSTWACNVRKVKHQSGEAYISRRGKYVPERKIKSTKDCLTSCKFKCNKKITDTDRELIFKAFYSLTSNEKKHFLLNTTERHKVKQPQSAEGNSTLSISQKPVYNVHAGKSELNIPKPDGRGLSPASYHGLPASVKDTVRTHIMSFKTVDSTQIKQFSKKQQHLVDDTAMKINARETHAK
ncbi:hypothetical protein NE865_05168 [Phthorimaea operculella]|nr:hypothetical protein NE865_05168 [Phthorimaea operculella]